MMTHKYDKEFKLNAVQLYLQSGKSLEVIACDLGMSRATLGHWVTQYKQRGNQSFPGSGTCHDQELTALKKELHLVKMERDILKKAIAIFSEPPRKGTRS